MRYRCWFLALLLEGEFGRGLYVAIIRSGNVFAGVKLEAKARKSSNTLDTGPLNVVAHLTSIKLLHGIVLVVHQGKDQCRSATATIRKIGPQNPATSLAKHWPPHCALLKCHEQRRELLLEIAEGKRPGQIGEPFVILLNVLTNGQHVSFGELFRRDLQRAEQTIHAVRQSQ